jgi:uncharacterized protein YukE
MAFASVLQRKAEELRSRRSAMTGAVAQLAGGWRDAKFVQFQARFTEALRDIDLFCNTADTYVQHVRGKARRAQAFLDHKGY